MSAAHLTWHTRNKAPQISILGNKPSRQFPSQNLKAHGGWIPRDARHDGKGAGSKRGTGASLALGKGRKGWRPGLSQKRHHAVSPPVPVRWRRSHNHLGVYNLYRFEITVLSGLFKRPQCGEILLSAIQHHSERCGREQQTPSDTPHFPGSQGAWEILS